MNPKDPSRPVASFRPNLNGCVAKDPRLARATEECYREELASSAAYTYRSLLTESENPILADRMDDFAVEDAEHFRMLGKLILALGCDPSVRARIFVGGDPRRPCSPLSIATDALRQEQEQIDRLQTLLGKSVDRVVRSLLSYILADHSRRISFLEEMARSQKTEMA